MQIRSAKIREVLSKLNLPDDLVQEFIEKVEVRQRQIIEEGMITRPQKKRRKIIVKRKQESKTATFADAAAITMRNIGRNC